MGIKERIKTEPMESLITEVKAESQEVGREWRKSNYKHLK
jgi:hypothetical protein